MVASFTRFDLSKNFKKFEVIFTRLSNPTAENHLNGSITVLATISRWPPVCFNGKCRLGEGKKAMTLSAENIYKTNPLHLRCESPRLISIEKIRRPSGYSIPGYSALCATVQVGEFKILGFGEGSHDIALKKAISEATERMALKQYSLKSGGPESSNGWACHVSKEAAIENAILELIERDVALSNWECNGPFYEIPDVMFPPPLLSWKENREADLEFSYLRVFLSENTRGACISTLLFNERGNFVVGHSSGLNLDAAILSSAAEAMRAAHASLRFENYKEVEDLHSGESMLPASPGAHSLAYAYNHAIPSSIVFKQSNSEEITMMWNKHCENFSLLNLNDFSIQVYEVGELFVARVKSNMYRSIHWGTKLIPETAINKNPHFVG